MRGDHPDVLDGPHGLHASDPTCFSAILVGSKLLRVHPAHLENNRTTLRGSCGILGGPSSRAELRGQVDGALICDSSALNVCAVRSLRARLRARSESLLLDVLPCLRARSVKPYDLLMRNSIGAQYLGHLLPRPIEMNVEVRGFGVGPDDVLECAPEARIGFCGTLDAPVPPPVSGRQGCGHLPVKSLLSKTEKRAFMLLPVSFPISVERWIPAIMSGYEEGAAPPPPQRRPQRERADESQGQVASVHQPRPRNFCSSFRRSRWRFAWSFSRSYSGSSRMKFPASSVPRLRGENSKT